MVCLSGQNTEGTPCGPFRRLWPYGFIFLLLLLSCSSGIRYRGKSYPPTNTVDFFSRHGQVRKPFIVMGSTEQTAYRPARLEKIKAALMTMAKKRGADAVILIESALHDNNASENIAVISPAVQTDPTDPSVPVPGNPGEKSVRYLSAEFLKYK